mmetsp:Transcript_5884/g.12923  ORF Transcript_5884/g.12923 Transcript_5884/m.12923 type:complete len:88 (-) Transcript_5884:190-453(-)
MTEKCLTIIVIKSHHVLTPSFDFFPRMRNILESAPMHPPSQSSPCLMNPLPPLNHHKLFQLFESLGSHTVIYAVKEIKEPRLAIALP